MSPIPERHEIKQRIASKVHTTDYISSAVSDIAGAVADELVALYTEIDRLRQEHQRVIREAGE